MSGLPEPGTFERWSPQRKRLLIHEIRYGRMTVARACELYGLEEAEVLEWQQRLFSKGLRGLKVSVKQ